MRKNCDCALVSSLAICTSWATLQCGCDSGRCPSMAMSKKAHRLLSRLRLYSPLEISSSSQGPSSAKVDIIALTNFGKVGQFPHSKAPAEHSDHVRHEKPILSSASNSVGPSQYQRPDKDRNLGYLMDRSSHTFKFQLAGHASLSWYP